MSVARSAALNLHDNHVGGMPNGIPSKTRGYRFELAHARMKTRMHEHARLKTRKRHLSRAVTSLFLKELT